MPRSFDSDQNPPILEFTENVECPACSTLCEGEFVDHNQSLTVQDMVEPPQGRHECPECGHQWVSELTGWMFYGESG